MDHGVDDGLRSVRIGFQEFGLREQAVGKVVAPESGSGAFLRSAVGEDDCFSTVHERVDRRIEVHERIKFAARFHRGDGTRAGTDRDIARFLPRHAGALHQAGDKVLRGRPRRRDADLLALQIGNRLDFVGLRFPHHQDIGRIAAVGDEACEIDAFCLHAERMLVGAFSDIGAAGHKALQPGGARGESRGINRQPFLLEIFAGEGNGVADLVHLADGTADRDRDILFFQRRIVSDRCAGGRQEQ